MGEDVHHPVAAPPLRPSHARMLDCLASFSVLAIAATLDGDDAASVLLPLAEGLRESGHHLRLVTASGAGVEATQSPALDIVYAPLHASAGSGRLHSAGTVAAYSKVIYHALSAEPTHIIHILPNAPPHVIHAVSLATFTYTVRHPFMPEPAVVTTIGKRGHEHERARESDASDRVHARGNRPVHLVGDSIIIFSEHVRDVLVRATHDRHLPERVHVVPMGCDLVPWIVTVYRAAWERRQHENERSLLPIEL